MKIDRALKIRRDLELAYRDVYSSAKSFGFLSSEINEKLAESRKRIAPPKTPGWVFAYLDGYSRALNDSLYQTALVHGGYVNGIFYSTHSNRPDYYLKHGIEPAAWGGAAENTGHYWAHNTAKPFFIG